MIEENEMTPTLSIEDSRARKVMERWDSKHKGNRWKGGTVEELKVNS